MAQVETASMTQTSTLSILSSDVKIQVLRGRAKGLSAAEKAVAAVARRAVKKSLRPCLAVLREDGTNAENTQLAFVQAVRRAHPREGGSAQMFAATVLEFEEKMQAGAAAEHPPAAAAFGRSLGSPQAAARQKASARAPRRDAFCERLRSLLQAVSADTRREIISGRLSEDERKRLEEYMTRQKAPVYPDRGSKRPLEASCGNTGAALQQRRSSTRGFLNERLVQCRVAYRPALHLDGGLYMQAPLSHDLSASLAALGVMIAAKAELAARKAAATQEKQGQNRQAEKPLEHLVQASVQAAMAACAWQPVPRFSFRSRFAGGSAHAAELASPSRGELADALRDWRALRQARRLPAEEARQACARLWVAKPGSRTATTRRLTRSAHQQAADFRAEDAARRLTSSRLQDEKLTRRVLGGQGHVCTPKPQVVQAFGAEKALRALERLLAQERQRRGLGTKITRRRADFDAEHRRQRPRLFAPSRLRDGTMELRLT
eukprot:TRINITY_DN7469_c0_g1_i1.p1 TRINITY_DN7469_c0_g1~~TRINITY_DN7469_c0_g1_i1.p1  ORF type:complete len:491 (-),score=111.22 TRINITY_DN7469_c0_g1_i1:105-1577(-)